MVILYHDSYMDIFRFAPVSGTLFNEKYYHDLEAKVYGTKTLETKRLILRKLTMDDLDDCIKNWWNDEEVTRYMTWNPHNDRESI
jgi:RimJ/RimL family protein N-acetyltransferase